jgi:general L-amino acid transport system ATP-binding protein
MNMREKKKRRDLDYQYLVDMHKINKWYGNFHVLRDIDFSVIPNEKVVVCGPSGSGKSTLIRTINLLEEFQQGTMEVCGKQLSANNITKKIKREINHRIGMVFQQFNLFPHLTVLQNLTVGPVWGSGISRQEANHRAQKYLKHVHLEEYINKYPNELSGGQQQRVAIARSLCLHPDILLFDEPTAALDPELVNEVLQVIEKLAGEGMTMIIVTHEMGFARNIADRIVFMDQGQIIEEAQPDLFFDQPRSSRLKEFLGQILTH